MIRRPRLLLPSLPARALVGVALAAALVLTATSARAENRRVESAARHALHKAADEFLALKYDKAIARLSHAIAACGKSRCTEKTHAELLRDRGTMLLAKGSKQRASADFIAALKIAPTLELNPDYATRASRAAWSEARQSVIGLTQPTGDFTHTPAPEQQVHTPLPVYVEDLGENLARVIVRYRGEGMGEFRTAKLKPLGKGWGGEIPCAAVETGMMRYYILGYDRRGEPVANTGNVHHPFMVPIRENISSPSPHLPHRPAPEQCEDCNEHPESCGRKEESRGGIGAVCDVDAQCESGACRDDRCVASAPAQSGGTTYARWWFGVATSMDLVGAGASGDVCKLDANAAPVNGDGYYCTNPDGTDFPTRDSPDQNATLGAGDAGQAGGGLFGGNVRVMASFDYALNANFLVGARLGWAVTSYPGQAASKDGRELPVPIHVEARATFVFGEAALADLGFAPVIFGAAGVSNFDAGQTVMVTQSGIPGQQPIVAWRVGGPGFIAVGGGFRYALSQRIAFSAAAKFTAALGPTGFLPTIGPEVALQYGF